MSARNTRRISRTAAGALAIVAFAAPVADARPALEPPGDTSSGSAGVIAYEADPPAPSITVADDGFEWASAAIGAGGAAVVLLLTATGAMTVSRRHHRVGAIH